MVGDDDEALDGVLELEGDFLGDVDPLPRVVAETLHDLAVFVGDGDAGDFMVEEFGDGGAVEGLDGGDDGDGTAVFLCVLVDK